MNLYYNFEIGLEENERFPTIFNQAIEVFFKIVVCSLLDLVNFSIFTLSVISALELPS